MEQKKSCFGGTLWKVGENDDGGVDERYPLEIIDCSSTSWWTYGSAVRVTDYNKFLLHDQLIVKSRGLIRKDAAGKDILAAQLRRPLYAVIGGDFKAATQEVWRGTC